MPGRQYTDEERAAAVALANSGTAKGAAEALGIPRPTLLGWTGVIPTEQTPGKTHSYRSPAKVDPELVSEISERIAGMLDVAVDRMATRIAEAAAVVPIESAKDLRDVSVALGINTEKRALLRGGATSRAESLHALLIAVVPPTNTREEPNSEGE